MAQQARAENELGRLWDLPTRLFHIGLLTSVAGCWWTYVSNQMVWHRLCGYSVIGLLIFRFYWGVFGSSTAQFRSFLRSPRETWRYVTGRTGIIVGHNPLGGWNIAALLVILTTEVGSGLFTS